MEGFSVNTCPSVGYDLLSIPHQGRGCLSTDKGWLSARSRVVTRPPAPLPQQLDPAILKGCNQIPVSSPVTAECTCKHRPLEGIGPADKQHRSKVIN